MTHSKIQQIENILRSRSVGESHSRLALASKLAQHKRPFTSETVDRLAAHYTGLGQDPASHIMLAIQSGDWAELDEDLLDQQRQARADIADEKRGSSGMSFVNETNPYGWANRDFMQSLDHDQPGQWNAYRQSYNLTVAEREALGARDHRRRGCSRYEVLGHSKEATGWRPGKESSVPAGNGPRIEFDRLEVERAKGNDFGDPGASQGRSEPSQERKVYGE